MNKQQFHDAYRRARLAAGFFFDMLAARGLWVESMFRTLDQCPGFDFTRLHGDSLTWVLDGIARRDLNAHRRLLHLISGASPRLP